MRSKKLLAVTGLCKFRTVIALIKKKKFFICLSRVEVLSVKIFKFPRRTNEILYFEFRTGFWKLIQSNLRIWLMPWQKRLVVKAIYVMFAAYRFRKKVHVYLTDT